MKYTPDQLVALVEEARGHVHDVMMGAIWNKERYAKCANFMERTDVVECEISGRNTLLRLQPLKRNKGEADTALSQVNVDKMFKHIKNRIEEIFPKSEVPMSADKVTRELVSVQPIDKDVFKKKPQEAAQDLIMLGYKGGDGSIDSAVKDLMKRKVKGSRDFLREVVKLIRQEEGMKS